MMHILQGSTTTRTLTVLVGILGHSTSHMSNAQLLHSSQSMEKQKKMLIYTAATALTLETGEVVILEFGKVSWLEKWMKRSLVNPNKCCYYSVNLCDDPTEKYHTLGVEK